MQLEHSLHRAERGLGPEQGVCTHRHRSKHLLSTCIREKAYSTARRASIVRLGWVLFELKMNDDAVLAHNGLIK